MSAAMTAVGRERGRSAGSRPARTPAPYSSKIIKAGAIVGDTKTLLSLWDVAASPAENLQRMQRDNVLGKASRARVADILAIFRQRYLVEASVTSALVALARGNFPSVALEKILYFHSARADRLLRDAVTEILAPMHEQGLTDLQTRHVQRSLTHWGATGQTAGPWSEPTIARIGQGLLATLRDFGVLQGRVHKKIAPAFLPIEAFAYIMFYLKQHQPSGVRLIERPDWKLFFLTRDGVERYITIIADDDEHLIDFADNRP